MGTIQKGFALTTAIIGVLYLICGAISLICAFRLNAMLPNGFTFFDINGSMDSNYERISFGSYWWGGTIFFIPGTLGIIAACTKNVCAMAAFLVFTILCILSSIGFSIVMALIIVVWTSVNEVLNDGLCTSIGNSCSCLSSSFREAVTLSVDCDVLRDVSPMLLAICAGGALALLISLVASYISCCALCNQEQANPGVVMVQQPPMVYANPNQLTTIPASYPPAGYPAPQFYSQQPPTYNPTSDTLKLVENQVV